VTARDAHNLKTKDFERAVVYLSANKPDTATVRAAKAAVATT
jgi:hypothetical protein